MMRTMVSSRLVSLLAVSLLVACSGSEGRPSEGSPPADAAPAAAPAVTVASSRPMPGEPTLEEVRRATEKYRDVRVAEADGYVRDPMDICDTAEMMGRPASDGAMGIHFVRLDALGISGPPSPRVSGTSMHTDFLTPAVLIYEPQRDGSLELVAVENLAFKAAWEAAGNTAPPTFHGVPYDYMVDDPATELDEAHMFEPHYDRHVWIYRENPKGVFAPFNPAVTCEHHKGNVEHSHG